MSVFKFSMAKKFNSHLVKFAAGLRKNMTKEERHLWYDFLHNYPVKFLRQKIIGNYVVDFYCSKVKLVIEIDGSQHYSDKGEIKDAERTEFLKTYGLDVIRILNSDINNNFNGVCEYIDNIVKANIRKE